MSFGVGTIAAEFSFSAAGMVGPQTSGSFAKALAALTPALSPEKLNPAELRRPSSPGSDP